jgi:hypothetical protein
MENPILDITARDMLLPYQKPHLDILLASMRANHCTLDLSDTGTGKTWTASAACVELNFQQPPPVFIIAPKAILGGWVDVTGRLGVNVLGFANPEILKVQKYYKGNGGAVNAIKCPWIKIIRTRKSNDYEWDFTSAGAGVIVIIDEAHRGKNNLSLTSKLFLRLKNKVDKILLLSATITDTIPCFRTAAYLLGLAQHDKYAYGRWVARLGGEPIKSIRNLLIPKYGGRMSIRDIKSVPETANLFPHNDVAAITVEMSPAAEAEIEAAYREIATAQTDLKLKTLAADCILAVLVRARQRIELAKVPTLCDMAAVELKAGKSVVIFVNFSESGRRIYDILHKFDTITFINGTQTFTERAENIEAFQSNKSRLMIAQIRAGGVGISLHDIHGEHPRVALIVPTWSPIDLKQSLGRIYRAGSKTPAVQRIIYCKGGLGGELAADIVRAAGIPTGGLDSCPINDTTFRGKGIEEIIATSVNIKLRNIEWINNGDEDELVQL